MSVLLFVRRYAINTRTRTRLIFLSLDCPRVPWPPSPSRTSSKTVNFSSVNRTTVSSQPAMSDTPPRIPHGNGEQGRTERTRRLFFVFFFLIFFCFVSLGLRRNDVEKRSRTHTHAQKTHTHTRARARALVARKRKEKVKERDRFNFRSHTRHEHVVPQPRPAAYTRLTRYSIPHHGSANCGRMTAERTRVVIVCRLRALLSLPPPGTIAHFVVFFSPFLSVDVLSLINHKPGNTASRLASIGA